MMNLKIMGAILTTLCIQQGVASDTMHLDIQVNDDGSIKVQPASVNTSESGETLELGSCDQQRILRRESFPILQDIPIIQGLPKGQEIPTNQICAQLLDDMWRNDPNATNRVPESDIDVKCDAAAYIEGLQLLMALRYSANSCTGRATIDHPSRF